MRSLLGILTAAMLATGAEAATPPAKPAPTTAPAKAAPFDVRDPAALSALLVDLKAQTKITKSEGGQVLMDVTTPAGGFGVQMLGCDEKGKACHAMALFTAYEKKGATLQQINDFNRAQFACRGILAPDGSPSVMYSTLLNLRMTADETKQHLGIWQGCLKGFADFTNDPVAFLSKAH